MSTQKLNKTIGKVEDARTSAEEGLAENDTELKDSKLEEIAETLEDVTDEMEEMIDDDET
jgi:hypothetical protein